MSDMLAGAVVEKAPVRALPASLVEVLAEGYIAIGMGKADPEEAVTRAKDAFTANAGIQQEAEAELKRLDELHAKVGRIENRCYISATNRDFLRRALGRP